MTKQEAIICAYTGIFIGEFDTFHIYAEKLFGRSVWTHEFASDTIAKQLKELATKDFMDLEVV